LAMAGPFFFSPENLMMSFKSMSGISTVIFIKGLCQNLNISQGCEQYPLDQTEGLAFLSFVQRSMFNVECSMFAFTLRALPSLCRSCTPPARAAPPRSGQVRPPKALRSAFAALGCGK
jgi:hypothetical protein